MNEMRDLGWANGWEPTNTPRVILECATKGHVTTKIDHDDTRRGLDTEYRCEICGYFYHVDSSD